MTPHDLDTIATVIVDAAFQIHKRLGPGLLESVYESVFERDLKRRGLFVERQRPVTFEFEGMKFKNGLFIDLLVERAIIIEIKVVEQLHPAHFRQVLTYLRLTNLPLGFLINFDAPSFKAGIKRIVN